MNKKIAITWSVAYNKRTLSKKEGGTEWIENDWISSLIL
mgnify:CR=1 FL=1